MYAKMFPKKKKKNLINKKVRLPGGLPWNLRLQVVNQSFLKIHEITFRILTARGRTKLSSF